METGTSQKIMWDRRRRRAMSCVSQLSCCGTAKIETASALHWGLTFATSNLRCSRCRAELYSWKNTLEKIWAVSEKSIFYCCVTASVGSINLVMWLTQVSGCWIFFWSNLERRHSAASYLLYDNFQKKQKHCFHSEVVIQDSIIVWKPEPNSIFKYTRTREDLDVSHKIIMWFLPLLKSNRPPSPSRLIPKHPLC